MTDSQAKSQQPASAKLAGDDEIDLLDYLRVVWRYRWMILALCIIAMGLTVVMSMRQPRRFQSSVTIVPPLDILQRESGGALGAMNNSLLRQMMDTASSSIAKLYVEILQSREVADALIDRFRLMEAYEKVEYRADARNQLQKNAKMETTDGGAVKITVLDRDPNRSAAIASAYVEELDKRNKKLSTGQATSKRIFLENRLKEVEAKLSKIDSTLSREVETQERLYEMLVTQFEMAKIDEAKSMPTIQVLDPPVVPERGVPHGTVKKGILGGIAAFMLAVFLAFSREYVLQARQRGTGRTVSRKEGAQAPASCGPA